MTVAAGDGSPAGLHAVALLRRLGAGPAGHAGADLEPDPTYPSPLAAWAGGGGAALTGPAGGPPLGGPAPVAAAMDGAAAALRALARRLGKRLGVDGPALLGERAAALGLGRHGSVSPGGACRFLQVADGWIAVNLPRPEDWELLPAWLEVARVDGWPEVDGEARHRRTGALVARGRMLGIAVTDVIRPCDLVTDPQGRDRAVTWPVAPWRIRTMTGRAAGRASRSEAPRVVDLSSLWAGPLATRLLADLGAEVIKVESSRRPDGARSGSPIFFDRLNHGVRSVALDLRAAGGADALARLLRSADVVVEASRPRALDQLGCSPEELAGGERPQVWVSITGYGRTGPWRQQAAFGDDAGVAGGLAVLGGESPQFCADAVADPATGLHAALAALACWHAGDTVHVDIAMREVAASLVPGYPDGLPVGPAASNVHGRWLLEGTPVAPPSLSPVPGHAPPLGAHTVEVLREVGMRP